MRCANSETTHMPIANSPPLSRSITSDSGRESAPTMSAPTNSDG